MNTSKPAKVFGQMIEYANGKITAFHSDLYHDAMALHQSAIGPNANGDFYLTRPFLWFIGPNGTHLYWMDKSQYYPTAAKIAEDYPYIYFYDGYTLAPIGLNEIDR